MKQQTKQKDAWEICPAGALVEFSARDASRRLRQRYTNFAAASCVGVLLLTIGYFGLSNLASSKVPSIVYPHGGGLACLEVLQRMEPFFASELESDDRARVLQHLQDCPRCHRKYRDRARELNVSIASAASLPSSPQWFSIVGSQLSDPPIASIVPLLRSAE